jgi:hypothetical protein
MPKNTNEIEELCMDAVQVFLLQVQVSSAFHMSL